MTAWKLTGAVGSFPYEHHSDLRTVLVWFHRGTAFLATTENQLAEAFYELGYDVEHVDRIPVDYLTAARHAHTEDPRVLVPGAAS